ncbi:MAG: DMT family transporter [Parasporobacterium sp.]|nr:DMT family transporter [Parasporobacterium sp.]
MKNSKSFSSLALLAASLFWGISFVTQSVGGKQLGAYTFNGLRLLLGALVLFIITRFSDRFGISRKPETREEKRLQFTTGLLCGIFLCVATNLQQVALNLGASAGKAGFLTAMYILLVPIIGLLFKQKCGWNVWVAVAVALVGLYFLCVKGEFVLSLPDVLLLFCALGFSLQIITIDQRGAKVDSLRLSGMQFLVAGIITIVPALITEVIPYPGGLSSWLSLWTSGTLWINFLYMGIMSCGVSYTLQIIGQKGLEPSIAALLMSLESVFAALSGWVILGEKMSGKEMAGCAIIFGAVILAQLRLNKRDKVKKGLHSDIE